MRADINPLLMQIYEIGFAMDDIVLYLDTHPTDQNALNYYQEVKRLRDEAMCTYEASYGPLLNSDVDVSSQGWSWINDPWPWEREV